MSRDTIKMNVVQLYERYPFFYQPYIIPVVDLLLERNDIDVQVYAFMGQSDEDHVTIFPNYYLRKVKEKFFALKNGKYNPKLNFAEITFLETKVDLIHIQHSFLFPKILGLLQLPKHKRPKIIITLRGGDTYVKPWVDDKWNTFFKDTSHLIDAFITISEDQKAYLQKWNVPENSIHVIPISIGEKTNAKPKHLHQKEIRIVSAHRMCWEKNIDGNLRVIAQLKSLGHAVQYDVYGDGPDTGQLHYLIDKYDLKNQVNYKDKVDNKIYKQQLADYDFFLQLSHSEAFGASVVEAQSYGLPAIISNSGGLPETIVDAKSGYCVDAWDVQKAAKLIDELIKDSDKFYQFSEKAIQFSNENFTTDVEVEKLLKLYHTLSND